MCTATLLPPGPAAPAVTDAPGLRLVTSRDEQHARAAALPPQLRTYGERTALLPIDPAGGGTWVGVNDAGLVITLLNLNVDDAPPVPVDAVTRGGVIPGLLHCATAHAAAAQAERLDARMMRPFRLLIADAHDVAEVRADGRTVRVDAGPRGSDALMLTSSGLGDHLVEGPRRMLFDAEPPRTAAAQDAFHRHRWADRLPWSVAMHRPDARTVSRTVVEVTPGKVTMSYTPVREDGTEGPAITASRPRHAGVSA